MSFDPKMVNKSWTLFLDRDGVINKKIEGGYVREWEQFKFLPKVKEALNALSEVFGTIIVLTNQQGIGKKLMTHEALKDIHKNMLQEIRIAGGRIDKIYYCPALKAENNPCRKPNPGMALQAREDFPNIDFKTTIFVGDSASDMAMADRVYLRKVLVDPADKTETIQHKPDMIVGSLYAFSNLFRGII